PDVPDQACSGAQPSLGPLFHLWFALAGAHNLSHQIGCRGIVPALVVACCRATRSLVEKLTPGAQVVSSCSPGSAALKPTCSSVQRPSLRGVTYNHKCPCKLEAIQSWRGLRIAGILTTCPLNNSVCHPGSSGRAAYSRAVMRCPGIIVIV